MLPDNRENKVGMPSDKRKVARQQQAGRQTQFVGAKFAYIGKVTGSHFNCNVHQCSLDGNISAESVPFLPEIFFVKDCIKEITRFVPAVK